MRPNILACTHKGVFTVGRDGGKWRIKNVAFLGDDSPIALHDSRDDRLYVALCHGHFGSKLHRSDDGGANWKEVAVPVYPPKPEGVSEVNPHTGKETPWKLEKIWALEAGHPSEPGVLWCGTIPGGLFKSADGGESWQMVQSLWDEPRRKKWMGGGADLPGIHSVCVDSRDGRRVTIGVSCGGIWRTTDAGATWELIGNGLRAEYAPPEQAYDPLGQDPHILVRCRDKPDCFWIQHHNGVFRSTDGAATFEEITTVLPSVFGFAVAVHPHDPDTAWTVPAIKDEKRIPVDGQVVVSRTRDGGKTWEVLRNGLPREHAYDLTFRHALDIDAAGETLAFGSTTGSLWVSEDQGDSWQTVSEHLPPVYCVRFVQ